MPRFDVIIEPRGGNSENLTINVKADSFADAARIARGEIAGVVKGVVQVDDGDTAPDQTPPASEQMVAGPLTPGPDPATLDVQNHLGDGPTGPFDTSEHHDGLD